MKLGFIDATILVVYLAIVAFIGFWVGRKEKKTTRDYFLAGSRLPWYAIGLSMVASSISTEQFMGEVGFAYSHGLAVANWEWLNFPALTMLIWLFTPFYIRGNIRSMCRLTGSSLGRLAMSRGRLAERPGWASSPSGCRSSQLILRIPCVRLREPQPCRDDSPCGPSCRRYLR